MRSVRVSNPSLVGALLAGVSTVATIASGSAPTAHAIVDSYWFQTPSSNIVCAMTDFLDGTGAVSCQLKEHTWTAPPPGGDCPEAGDDVLLVRGAPACVGFTMNDQIWLAQQWNELPTLDYGQSHTLAMLTCTSDVSGVRCADTDSGHYFTVSRDSYGLG